MLTNMDKLYESVAANGPVCVGLDTEISYLPTTDTARTAGENVVAFNRALIDATKGVAGCYKVQIAYYESLGLDGMRAYAETLKMARATGLPVIADIKRGDIAKTAEMYAKAHFTGDFEADIITLAPYMGLDSISPYLPYCAEQGKGVFVLCRTSNPSAKDFEYKKLDDGRHVYDLVGDSLTALGKDYMGEHGYSSIGLVIGGTHTEEATAIRAAYKDTFFLIPGYGAQGGKAADIAQYLTKGNGGVVNSSRGILLAYKKQPGVAFDEAAYNECVRMREDIQCECIERHLNRMRAQYKGKHDLLIRLLKEFGREYTVSGENAGVHVLVHLPRGLSEAEAVQRAKEDGVRVYGLERYCIGAAADPAQGGTVLLGYAGLSEEEIAEAAAILKKCWNA